MSKINDKIYAWTYIAWVWFGRKVIRIPFVLEWHKDNFIRAITFSWSLEYAQRVQENWEVGKLYNTLLSKHKKLQHDHDTALEEIAILKKGEAKK